MLCHLPSMVYGWFASFPFLSYECGNHHTLLSLFSEPLMLSQSVREQFLDILERKLIGGNLKLLHFAMNVKKCKKTGRHFWSAHKMQSYTSLISHSQPSSCVLSAFWDRHTSWLPLSGALLYTWKVTPPEFKAVQLTWMQSAEIPSLLILGDPDENSTLRIGQCFAPPVTN